MKEKLAVSSHKHKAVPVKKGRLGGVVRTGAIGKVSGPVQRNPGAFLWGFWLIFSLLLSVCIGVNIKGLVLPLRDEDSARVWMGVPEPTCSVFEQVPAVCPVRGNVTLIARENLMIYAKRGILQYRRTRIPCSHYTQGKGVQAGTRPLRVRGYRSLIECLASEVDGRSSALFSLALDLAKGCQQTIRDRELVDKLRWISPSCGRRLTAPGPVEGEPDLKAKNASRNCAAILVRF
jgi:hypothetical protein